MLIYVMAMGWLMYVLCRMLVVPSKEFLFDYMLASTTILQRASHMRPKWHILNDSVQEMVTVGRETV